MKKIEGAMDCTCGDTTDIHNMYLLPGRRKSLGRPIYEAMCIDCVIGDGEDIDDLRTVAELLCSAAPPDA